MLAGHNLPSEWNWQTIRQEFNPKETYFIPLAKERNLLSTPGEGRKILAAEAAKKYNRIRQARKISEIWNNELNLGLKGIGEAR